MITGDKPITTEWEDLQRKYNGQKTRVEEYYEHKKAQDEAEQEILDALAEPRYDDLSYSELDELEDDLDDDLFRELKARQVALLEKMKEKQHFGDLIPITREEYTPMVQDKQYNTIVLIHDPSVMESRIAEARFKELARCKPLIRIALIPNTQATSKPDTAYPSKMCPTAVVYVKGAIKARLVTLAELGGRNGTVEELAEILKPTGVLRVDE